MFTSYLKSLFLSLEDAIKQKMAALERSDERLSNSQVSETQREIQFSATDFNATSWGFVFFFLPVLSLYYPYSSPLEKTHWNHVSQVSDLFHCLSHCFMHLKYSIAWNSRGCAKRHGVNRVLGKGNFLHEYEDGSLILFVNVTNLFL